MKGQEGEMESRGQCKSSIILPLEAFCSFSFISLQEEIHDKLCIFL